MVPASGPPHPTTRSPRRGGPGPRSVKRRRGRVSAAARGPRHWRSYSRQHAPDRPQRSLDLPQQSPDLPQRTADAPQQPWGLASAPRGVT